MIDTRYVQQMARYNAWQNQSLYGAADKLTDAERRKERGAFFGSIQKTFSHLMYADRLWISRFTGSERPPGRLAESPLLYPDWELLKREREAVDGQIVRWADGLDPAWLAGALSYRSESANRDITDARGMLVTHFFNHQTHHRGQIHCMLTQAGSRPDDTDLPLMPGA